MRPPIFLFCIIIFMKNAEIFRTKDGSIGLYNRELDEIYHSKEGAQKESIEKFIIPSAFEKRTQKASSIRVLDICYGIGYNSKNALVFYKNCDITIDALEWDEELVRYSKEAEFFDPKINEFLCAKRTLGKSKINFYIDDARKSIKGLNERYDVIFLDAFAPNKLPTLWSYDFFKELKRLIKPKGVLVTYSSALPVRNALYSNGFFLAKALDEKGHSYLSAAALNKDVLFWAENLVALDDKDFGLMKTRAGIVYRDENLCSTPEDMLKRRENEVKESNLMGASAYLKHYGSADA